jgi:AraC family transcriptional regulator
MVEAAQPPGDCSDKAGPDLVLIAMKSRFRHRCNVGGGVFTKPMGPDDLVLVAQGTATEVIVDDPHVIRLMGISSEFLEVARPDGSSLPARLDFGFLHDRSFRDELVTAVMDRLWREAEQGDAISRLYADGASMLLLAALMRRAKAPPAPIRGGLAPWQARRAMEMIRANVAGEVTLEALAADVNLSPWHFARSFKTSLGVAPHAYQISCRLERAKDLLASTAMPVTEIALEVGYENSQSLARVFRRFLGVSPSEYRRRYKTGTS